VTLVMGLGQPTLGLENFPLKIAIFHFSPSDQKTSHRVGSKNILGKERTASFILRLKSMPGSVQGPSLGDYVWQKNEM